MQDNPELAEMAEPAEEEEEIKVRIAGSRLNPEFFAPKSPKMSSKLYDLLQRHVR